MIFIIFVILIFPFEISNCDLSSPVKEISFELLKIYPFKNIMLRQHAVYPDKFDELLSNCNKYKVKAVNINLQYADDEKIKDIRRAGIKIFWAVENDFVEYKSKYLGDGVVSDWITEDEIGNVINK